MSDSATLTAAAPQPRVPDGRCSHLRADGKRCTSATYPGHSSLCHYHLGRQMRGIADGDVLAADILRSIGNFQSAAAINIALGKILVHQVTGRISREDALALCYNCQLLLQTLPALKAELKESGHDGQWQSETDRILSADPDLCHLTFTSLLPKGYGPLKPAPFDGPRESPPQSASQLVPAQAQ